MRRKPDDISRRPPRRSRNAVRDPRDRGRSPRRRQHHPEIDRRRCSTSARCVGDWLEHWARQTPERIFLGERANVDAPWTTVTYSDALRQVRSVAAWILAQGLSAERPLVILSDNSVDHALFALGGDACRRARRRRSRRPIR